jgi:hypothetical protein
VSHNYEVVTVSRFECIYADAFEFFVALNGMRSSFEGCENLHHCASGDVYSSIHKALTAF